jgi:hypothetical protein
MHMTTTRAQPGERTITLEIQFFTNKLAKGDGHVRPKHAHTAGMVRVRANPTHGIKAAATVPFHSLMEIPAAIEKLLTRRGIRLHPTPKMRYLEAK